jgi:hypothetical protein
VVTTAVLAILITAPLGSVLIALFGPRLLRTATAPEKATIDLEFPNGDGIDPLDAPRDVFALQSPRTPLKRSRATIEIDSINSLPANSFGGSTQTVSLVDSASFDDANHSKPNW